MLNAISVAFTCDYPDCRRGIVLNVTARTRSHSLAASGWTEVDLADGFDLWRHFCPSHAHTALLFEGVNA